MKLLTLNQNQIPNLITQSTLKTSEHAAAYAADSGKELMNILNNGEIRTVFQPIISLKDASLLGYEALSRGPHGSVLENPANLFDVARIHDKLWEVELLCRLKALENVSKLLRDTYIFINVDPAVINDEKFKAGFTKEFLRKYNIDSYNIIFEITEKSAVSDYKSFRAIIDHYKDEGYKIAIDDTGSGYSGLLLISEIHPHYIKLDMDLIRDIDKDGLKRSLIKTFCDFCLVTDIKLIAEGIETENELATLIDMGIDYGQGFFIQRPMEDIAPIGGGIKDLVGRLNTKRNKIYTGRPSKIAVGDIARKNKTIKPSALGCEVINEFEQKPLVYALPIVEKGKVIGLVMKENFFAKMGTKYGFTLYLNRPVSLIMNAHPLVVDCNKTIDMVSKMAMTRSEENLYDIIIVTEKNEYLGIVTVKDLLEKTTEIEINYAKHLNPLSGLPGNMLIEHKLTELIQSSSPFTIMYLDIDNFKAYNDVYGFENGDRMLQITAEAIKGCVSEGVAFEDCFIGHIGGDDFVVCVSGYEVEYLCEAIIDEFSRETRDMYVPEDLMHGCVRSRNGDGAKDKIRNVTISIACITNKNKEISDIYELSKTAARIKKDCKEKEGSNYHIF
jgi:diguanylate cyclase (GGDEF)-like protein